MVVVVRNLNDRHGPRMDLATGNQPGASSTFSATGESKCLASSRVQIRAGLFTSVLTDHVGCPFITVEYSCRGDRERERHGRLGMPCTQLSAGTWGERAHHCGENLTSWEAGADDALTQRKGPGWPARSEKRVEREGDGWLFSPTLSSRNWLAN